MTHDDRRRYWLLSTLCLVTIIAYVQRLGLNTAEHEIRGTLGISTKETGWVMSAWSIGYALMQIPSGWFADRWGSRRALIVFATLWSLLTGAASLAFDLTTLLVFWFAMGMAQAGIFPCSTKAIGATFPETRRAFASGMLASSMAAGIALAPAITGRLLTMLDWRAVVFIYSVPGLLWVMLFIRTVDEPTTALARRPSGTVEILCRALRSFPIWMLCSQQFFRAAAMAFFMTWFPTFLRATRGVDLQTSGYLTGIAGAGALLGGVSGGAFSDWLLHRTGRRRLARQGLAVFGMASCGALIVSAYFVTSIPLAMTLMTLGTFLATFGGVSGYTLAIELGGRSIATVFSLMNMCGNIGAAIFPLAVGYIVAAEPGSTGSASRWTAVLFLCAGIFLVDAVCWALLNPKTNIDGEPL